MAEHEVLFRRFWRQLVAGLSKSEEEEMQGPPIIVGMGVVGQGTAYQLLRGGHSTVIGVDVKKRRRIPAHMPVSFRSRVDWRTELPLVAGGHYIICLPTRAHVPADEDARWSSGGYQDTSAIEQVLHTLAGLNARVTIRSLVLPQKFALPIFARVDYAWPTFFDERSLVSEVRRPKYDVVGARNAAHLAGWMFRPKFGHDREPQIAAGFATCAEAMAFAYLHTLWAALRHAFVNELEDCLTGSGIAADSSVLAAYFGPSMRPTLPYNNLAWSEHIAAWVGVNRHRATIADAIPYSNLLRHAGTQNVQLRFPPGATVTTVTTDHTGPLIDSEESA